MVEPRRGERKAVVAGDVADHAQRRRIEHVVLGVARELRVDMEERAVLDQRQAQRAAVLGAGEGIPDRVAAEVAARIGRAGVGRPARPEQRVGLGLELIAGAARGHVHDPVGRATELHGEAVGEHGDFARHAQRHRELGAAEEVLVVVEAVDQVIDVQAVGAVDRDRGRLGEEPGGRHHVGQPHQGLQHVAALDRQRGKLGRAQGRSHLRVHGVEARDLRSRPDRDGFERRSRQAQRQRVGVVAAQRQRRGVQPRALRVRRDAGAIGARGGQAVEDGLAIGVRDHGAPEADGRVAERDGNARDGLTRGGIAQLHLEGGLLGLREAGQQGGRERCDQGGGAPGGSRPALRAGTGGGGPGHPARIRFPDLRVS